jgi:LacI family transcriptional regulator
MQREEGYTKTMIHHGLNPLSIPLMPEQERIDKEEYGYKNIKRWVEEGAIPSAIFCATDTLALGAMKALDEKGLIPGEEILIAGHDDLSFSAYVRPALTTVRQPKTQIGMSAVNVVVQSINGELTGREFFQKQIQSKLIIRESA